MPAKCTFSLGHILLCHYFELISPRFVCAVDGNNDAATLIRSYKGRAYDQLLPVCKIWEAARATSAASRLFEPITIGPFSQKFVDGALRHNNPTEKVDSESTGMSSNCNPTL